MTKKDSRNPTKPASQVVIDLRRKQEFAHSLLGKFKGKDLLKALMVRPMLYLLGETLELIFVDEADIELGHRTVEYFS
jgi:hypothetical protein